MHQQPHWNAGSSIIAVCINLQPLELPHACMHQGSPVLKEEQHVFLAAHALFSAFRGGKIHCSLGTLIA